MTRKTQPDGDRATLMGAIRWDAWHGERGGPGRAVQSALSPRQWHYRLPFFAQVMGDDDVRIDGVSPETMEREIEFARKGGLDYWAFVTYSPDDPMSLGLQHYLASGSRHGLRFCLVTECARWGEAAYVQRLGELMREPEYLTVLDNRPVLYLGFITDDKVKQCWGDASGLRRVIDRLRSDVVRTGAGEPYIVIMDFKPASGRAWLDALGGDAISSYAVSPKGPAVPYAQLAAHAEAFWGQCRDTGAQVVPIVMSGWDRRPRVARPMPWETWQKPGVGIDMYCEAPTPPEFGAHAARAVKWIRDNPAHAQAALAIVYAWNENDEGGWLVPTLSDGPARLDALRQALANGAT